MLGRVLLAAMCVLCMAVAAASTASAAPPTPAGSFDGTDTPARAFGTSTPGRVAVDEASGDVYVLDPDHDAVDRFSSTGTFQSQITGVDDTAARSFGFSGNGANGIAVDNSGGAGQGDVYVVAAGSNTIFKFDASSTELWEAPGLAGTTCGIAVDLNGNPWAADFFATDLVQLRPDDGGQTTTTIAMAPSNFCYIAFDNDGAVYAASYFEGFDKYDGAGGSISIDPNISTFAVTSTFRRNDIFTVAKDGGTPVIRQWDKIGGRVSEVPGTAGADDFQGVAIDGVRNRLYVANFQTGNVQIYSVPAQSPTVTARATTDITTASATLHAAVNPNGSDVTECHGEWVTDAQFRSTGFTGARTAPCSPAPPISGVTGTDVTAAATGLTQNTTYHSRVLATNAGGTANGTDIVFVTRRQPVPGITTGAASNLTQTGATLTGRVNPNGDATSCAFQYGTTTGYGSEVATASPGSGSSEVAVNASVVGLMAGTVYHFRLTCRNSGGSGNGADVMFTTAPSPTCATDHSLCTCADDTSLCQQPPRTCLTDITLCRVTLKAVTGMRVTCTGDQGGICRGTLAFRAKVKVKVKRGRRTVTKTRTITAGRATYDLAVGGSSTLRISLTLAARNALKKGPLTATAVGLDGSVKIPKIKPRKSNHRRR
jgi:hypothetical protein